MCNQPCQQFTEPERTVHGLISHVFQSLPVRNNRTVLPLNFSVQIQHMLVFTQIETKPKVFMVSGARKIIVSSRA